MRLQLSLGVCAVILLSASGVKTVRGGENAEKYAAIEVGGSNVKYVLVNVDKRDDRTRISVAAESKTANPGLSAGMGKSNAFQQDAIKRTVAAVGELFKELIEQHSVPAAHVAIVGSSGVADVKNRQELVDAVRTATGRTMDFISAETEVRYTLLGVVPDDERFTASLYDIGSSNTKWGQLDAQSKPPQHAMVTASIPHGSKTLVDKIRAKAGTLPDQVAFFTAATKMRQDIEREIGEQKAAFKAPPSNTAYVSGGAVFVMVTLVKPESARDEFVRLTADDFRRLEEQLRRPGAGLFDVKLDAVTDTKARDRATDDLATIRKIFTPEQVIAGGQIVLALADQFHWNDPDKTVHFARNGYKAWLNGYVKEFVSGNVGAPAAAAQNEQDSSRRAARVSAAVKQE